jgi:hypothetical protein
MVAVVVVGEVVMDVVVDVVVVVDSFLGNKSGHCFSEPNFNEP